VLIWLLTALVHEVRPLTLTEALVIRLMLICALASSVASSSENSFVDASGYKFSEKDKKPQKLKIKKPPANKAKGGNAKGHDNGAHHGILFHESSC
jgi:hypothetical protein